MRDTARVLHVSVKPKITRPVSKLGLLMQLPSGTVGCIARQMPVGSAHREGFPASLEK
jgi:hypothetical protein